MQSLCANISDCAALPVKERELWHSYAKKNEVWQGRSSPSKVEGTISRDHLHSDWTTDDFKSFYDNEGVTVFVAGS